jgi:hypothetical protein
MVSNINKIEAWKQGLKFPVCSIPVRCVYHAPVVILHDSSNSKDFSRSPYWLICPRLIQAIHRLESDGWLKILQELVDGPLQKQWCEYVENVVPQQLKENLTEDYFKVLEKESRLSIGGVQNRMRLKCLHAQYAHYCVHGTGFVGAFIHGMLLRKFNRDLSSDLKVYCEAGSLECELGVSND